MRISVEPTRTFHPSVENFPGFAEGVDGFQIRDNLRMQATKFGPLFEQAHVRAVDFLNSRFAL